MYKCINTNEEIVYYFGDLLINTSKYLSKFELLYTILKQFYILINQLPISNSITVVSFLADNIFKYQSTPNDNPILSITILTSWVLNMSTD